MQQLLFTVPRKQGSFYNINWKSFEQTSCYMHRRLHIHCLGQTDSATLRPDRHQVRRPCHQFANLYYSTSQRFLCHLAGETRQVEIIDTTWACITHTRWSGEDISAKNHTMSAKNLAEWQVNQLKSNLHMFHWFGGDWDETSSDTKNIGKECVLAFFQVRFHLRSISSTVLWARLKIDPRFHLNRSEI